eukprot:s2487_g8.t1
MQDITHQVNAIIQADQEFQSILDRANFEAESIVWADDLAIPIATVSAKDLPQAICRIMQAVHRVFQCRGFTFNMQRGKTSIVATFRGEGAPAMRARYQLIAQPGMTLQLGEATVFVHFMPSYKHLGTMYSSAHTLDQEIAVRVGMAKSAFAQISAPILCNRYLPLSVRLQLFRTLILSKLFFGLGSWRSPTSRQIAQIQGALTTMLRKVFRLTPDEVQRVSVAELMQKAQISSPRARMAVDRLLHAQRIWQHGPEMLQHAIHREEALTHDSWLFGLKHDIHWLCQLDTQDVPPLQELAQIENPDDFDLTNLFDFWQAGGRHWKLCIRRAWKRHLQQETMMTGILALHKQFFRLFHDAGATFDHDPLVDSNQQIRLARIETLQAHGPQLPLQDARQTQIDVLDEELTQIEQELQLKDIPPDVQSCAQQLWDFLTTVTHAWFEEFCQGGFDETLAELLADRWLSVLTLYEQQWDAWIEAEILDWGQHGLPEILSAFLDGSAEYLVDHAFAEMVADFPRQHLLHRKTFLLARQRSLDEQLVQDFPHRSVRIGTANAVERASTAAQIHSLFESQAELLQKVSSAQWLDMPLEAPLPCLRQPSAHRLFVVAHLFSGRRRPGDVHERLHFWARHYDLQILVLSLDTANSPTFGNLHHTSVTWANLVQLYRTGKISATLAGAPCETWSAARHYVLSDGDSGRQMPRPLRDAVRVLARRYLSPRELRQLEQGTLFFFQVLVSLEWSLITGALYLSEHPALPILQEAASVWKTPWIGLLLQHPEVILHTIGQWRWGCTVSKPTGLLAMRLPGFSRSMYRREVQNAKYPDDVAIGIGPDGHFKTSAHKEYPKPFCDALAGTIMDELSHRRAGSRCTDHEIPDELWKWLNEAAHHCGVLRADATWLPDYQGR